MESGEDSLSNKTKLFNPFSVIESLLDKLFENSSINSSLLEMRTNGEIYLIFWLLKYF